MGEISTGWLYAARRHWIARAEAYGSELWRRAIADGRPPLTLRALLAREPGEGRASRWLESVALHGAEAAGNTWLDNPPALASPLARLREAGGAPLLVVGDSHSRLHLRRGRRGRRFLVPVGAVLTGASARGLGAEVSRSGHGARVLAALEAAACVWKSPPPLLFVFGQVDLEFVHVFKRIAAGAAADDDEGAFDAFAAETVRRYVRWLTAAAMRWPASVTVASVFPPVLADAAWSHGYFSAHLFQQHGSMPPEVLARRLASFGGAPLSIRSARHRRFNGELRAALAGSRVAMWSDFAEMQAGAAVDARFVGKAAGRDHHLDYAATRAPMIERLWALAETSDA